MMLVRDGLQIGAWQWALRNSVPLAANASMWGVRESGWPPKQPTQSFRSSIAISKTFGRLSASAAETQDAPTESRMTPAIARNLMTAGQSCERNIWVFQQVETVGCVVGGISLPIA